MSPPTRLGIGVLYNPVLFNLLREETALVDYVEIIPDMFWTLAERDGMSAYAEHADLIDQFDELAARLPVVLHSVGLSIGSVDFFDERHVAQIALWQRRFNSPWHSDHLSFNRISVSGHDRHAGLAMPIPYDSDLLDLVSARVRQVQATVPALFLLENNVYFFDLPEQEMTEPEFLNRLCRETGCRLVLDIHNVYANARNHGFDARDFVAQIDPSFITEMHIAGGSEFQGMYTDSHAGPVPEPVWQNLEHALAHAPGVSAVTYEFHHSYYRDLKDEGVRRQLIRARDAWARVC
jgi:uncharacterized protein